MTPQEYRAKYKRCKYCEYRKHHYKLNGVGCYS